MVLAVGVEQSFFATSFIVNGPPEELDGPGRLRRQADDRVRGSGGKSGGLGQEPSEYGEECGSGFEVVFR